MAKNSNSDSGHVSASESADVKTYTQDEVDRIVRAALDSAGADPDRNTEPAIEEGPHLRDPVIAEAKREQLRAHKIRANDKRLTDDMKSLLQSS